MDARKVIVADDHGLWAAQWKRLLDERHPGKYLVEPTDAPEVLANRLGEDTDIWLAVIDLDFWRASRHTGLHALQAAEHHARRRNRERPLHTIVITVEESDNRVLFLHTAFQCFDPAPVDLIYKDNNFDTAVLDTLGHLSTNGRPGTGRFWRFLPRSGEETLMQRLLLGKPRRGNTDGPGILPIWKALAGITEEEKDDAVRSVQHLQDVTGIKSNHIYEHLGAAREVAALIALDMRFPPAALLNDAGGRRAGELIGPLREFACMHSLFFQAPELPALVEHMKTARRP